MKNRLEEALKGVNNNYIYPFLWMCGESDEKILQELEKIKEAGIRGICVESRPHPDFAGDQWWHDFDLIMDFARSNDMKVWMLDDDLYPSGHCNGIFTNGDHDKANRFLTSWSTDVKGPLDGGSMIVKSILKEGDKLVGALLCKRASEDNSDIILEESIDVTNHIKNGWLRYDIPDGLWRIIIFYETCHGEGKLDYFNILDSDSVRLLLDEVYEPHYERYKDDFGKTFEAFFSDEPEFGNLPWYDFQAQMGPEMKYIPWSEELKKRLSKRWGNQMTSNLPALWYQVGAETGHIRYEYMDEVTKQLKVSFSDQISEWCGERNVIHVGHIIEDDNSHGRLGCSTGHYFRSISGMGMAGIDVVLLQIMPGLHQTIHQWVASDRDGEFFHYMLGKLGSSLAHIQGEKKGRALCEIFGAFGWQEGVSHMKWLADHMLSRGINNFVPHSFSPKEFPDKDCPPHFYAGGNHAQFKYFKELMGYMNRLSHLLNDGKYISQVAVLYHPDAEWAGEAMLTQKPLRALMENQMEADIVSVDFLENAKVGEKLSIGEQTYEALVVPYSDYLPFAAGNAIKKITDAGIPVYFIDNKPKGFCENKDKNEDKNIREYVDGAATVTLSNLVDELKNHLKPNVELDGKEKDLRTYLYKGEYGTLLYCFNESDEKAIDLSLNVRNPLKFQEVEEYKYVYRYDAMNNRLYNQESTMTSENIQIPLLLEMGEAAVFILSNNKYEVDKNIALCLEEKETSKELTGRDWSLSYKLVNDVSEWTLLQEGDKVFGDITDWAAKEEFNGYLRYETEISLSEKSHVTIDFGQKIDTCEIFADDISLGKLIGAPYCLCMELEKGVHKIGIELATTPVYAVGDDWSALNVLPPLGLLNMPKIKIR